MTSLAGFISFIEWKVCWKLITSLQHCHNSRGSLLESNVRGWESCSNGPNPLLDMNFRVLLYLFLFPTLVASFSFSSSQQWIHALTVNMHVNKHSQDFLLKDRYIIYVWNIFLDNLFFEFPSKKTQKELDFDVYLPLNADSTHIWCGS